MAATDLSPRSAISRALPAVSAADDRLEAELADDVAALAERVDVALDRLDVGELRALQRHQLMADRQEPFADDVEPGGGQEMMDIGDAAGDRVLDRDHAEIGLAGGDRGERVLEGRAGHRLGVGIGLDEAMWELAPGSPWNAIFSFLLMALGYLFLGGLVAAAQVFASSRRVVSRSVGVSTPRRDGIDHGDVDPHAGFQRAELFEPLLPFQRRRRQLHEALQRRAAVGVEADMVVARPVAMRGGGAGEIQGAHPPPAERRTHRLHHIGVEALFLGVDLGRQRRDIDRGIGKRRQHVADILRRNGREIALQIDHDFRLTARIERFGGLEDPVRSGRVIGARHDGFAAMCLHHLRDLGRVGGDRNPADGGLLRPAQHMDDHGQPGDIQQRLVRQPRRGHAGRNQHQNAVGGHWEYGQRLIGNRPEIMGIGRKPARLYGLPEPGQTDISSLLGVRCESTIPGLFRRPARPRPSTPFPAWSLIQNGLLRNQ